MGCDSELQSLYLLVRLQSIASSFFGQPFLVLYVVTHLLISVTTIFFIGKFIRIKENWKPKYRSQAYPHSLRRIGDPPIEEKDDTLPYSHWLAKLKADQWAHKTILYFGVNLSSVCCYCDYWLHDAVFLVQLHRFFGASTSIATGFS